MEMDMTQHTIDNNGSQHLDMYGVRVGLQQVRGFEIAVTFMGGTWPDGEEVRTFPNMAEALAAVATIAAELEDEEGGDWGIEDEEPCTHGTRIVCDNTLRLEDDAYARHVRVITGTGNAAEQRDLDKLIRGLERRRRGE